MDDDIETLRAQRDLARRVAVTVANDFQHALLLFELQDNLPDPHVNAKAMELAEEWAKDYEYGV